VFLFGEFEQIFVWANNSKGEGQSKFPSLVKGYIDSLIVVGFL
jgi:hypothetical protein